MKTKGRRRMMAGLFFLVPGLFVGICFFSEAYAASSTYPDRPINLVVPFLPGGVTDLGARALAEPLEKLLKQSVVVVNKPGGATTVAGNYVATSKPDGYTLGFFPDMASTPEVFSYFYEAPYSSKDLKPICSAMVPVLGWTAKEDAPFSNMKDLVDFARKNPGAKVGIHGRSAVGYISMVVLNRAEKAGFIDVPMDSDAKIVPAILGGHVPVATPAFPAVKSLYEAKKVKVLALLIEKRADFAPEIPTFVELGYKLTSFPYLGIFAPKGTPDEVAKKVDEAVRKIVAEPDFQAKINSLGIQLSYQDTATFEKSHVRYREAYRVFFKEEGLVK